MIQVLVQVLFMLAQTVLEGPELECGRTLDLFKALFMKSRNLLMLLLQDL